MHVYHEMGHFCYQSPSLTQNEQLVHILADYWTLALNNFSCHFVILMCSPSCSLRIAFFVHIQLCNIFYILGMEACKCWLWQVTFVLSLLKAGSRAWIFNEKIWLPPKPPRKDWEQGFKKRSVPNTKDVYKILQNIDNTKSLRGKKEKKIRVLESH